MNYNVFNKKKVIITGHTGFKGSWLSLWLSKYNCKIFGISDKLKKKSSFNSFINNKVDNYFIDIKNYNKLNNLITKIRPDFVFHLAAQSIVSKSFEDPMDTFLTNSIGTLNILNSLNSINHKCSCVIITSDKCYENVEKKYGYKEYEKLGGSDPYSASKATAEIIFRSFFNSFLSKNKKIRIATARAGNVIGGNDWTDNRLIPDIIKSIEYKKKLYVRNLNATRPWQFVLEPLRGYLDLALILNKQNNLNGHSFNFGPKNGKSYTVKEILENFKDSFKGFDYLKQNISNKKFKESTLLSLNCDKAKKLLNWECKLNLKETLKFTSDWYLNYLNKTENIINFSYDQISEYEKKYK